MPRQPSWRSLAGLIEEDSRNIRALAPIAGIHEYFLTILRVKPLHLLRQVPRPETISRATA